MWHESESAKFSYMHTCKFNTGCIECMVITSNINVVMTEHIVDVREGQNSDGFDRYPYEEMEGQSLSILVEGEKQSRQH